ncbi:hypothetical protein CLG_0085 (plasmid) [Clostridium botulinum D str. 1873]|uniref:Uncharacterized protein n=1 Tax=Clostridium botulinum D str. 1873 TaxID=592027 RepID=A0A9N7AYY7_CLOBO|nr:hypothetical protein CLG_0085 [Clostridium botulinum D str. 1873]
MYLYIWNYYFKWRKVLGLEGGISMLLIIVQSRTKPASPTSAGACCGLY